MPMLFVIVAWLTVPVTGLRSPDLFLLQQWGLPAAYVNKAG